jgi:hypothetical protein
MTNRDSTSVDDRPPATLARGDKGETSMAHTVGRVLGGSPLSVLGRLILLSILVGVVLSTLGLDPMNIVRSLEMLARQLYATGFDLVRYLWRYFLLGAAVVIPLWLVMRLFRFGRK